MTKKTAVEKAAIRWELARGRGQVSGYVVADRLMVAVLNQYVLDLTLDICGGIGDRYDCRDN